MNDLDTLLLNCRNLRREMTLLDILDDRYFRLLELLNGQMIRGSALLSTSIDETLHIGNHSNNLGPLRQSPRQNLHERIDYMTCILSVNLTTTWNFFGDLKTT